MKYRFIESQRTHHSVARLCRVLAVSSSGYYEWATREPSATAIANAKLRDEIVRIHAQSRLTYGRPRIHAELTQKLYDGIDRLIEVVQPYDQHTDTKRWATRNFYDLSQNASVSDATGRSFHATGNLFKTQKLLANAWTDFQSMAYDPADRMTQQNEYFKKPGSSWQSSSHLYQYDADSGSTGLLSSETDGLAEKKTYAYDASSRKLSQSYSGDGGLTTPLSFGYDADDRETAITSSMFGTASFTLDALGNTISKVEASGGGVTDPATITYGYYPDGLEQYLGVSSSTYSYSQLKRETYRTDGKLQQLNFQPTGESLQESYTNGGRLINSGGIDVLLWSYTNGLASSYKIGSYNVNLTNDSEGSVTRMDDGTSPSAPCPHVLGYNLRNELVNDTLDYTTRACGSQTFYQNTASTDSGYLVRSHILVNATSPIGPAEETVTHTYDALNGLPTTNGTATTNGDGNGYTTTSQDTFRYDGEGRQTEHDLTTTEPIYYGKGMASSCQGNNSASTVQTFDFENHILSQHTKDSNNFLSCKTQATDFGTGSLEWGNETHPVIVTNLLEAPGTFTLHWDGDTLLYVSDASGRVALTNASRDAFCRNPCSHLQVVDRDQGGNATGLAINGGVATDVSFDASVDPSANSEPIVPVFTYLKSDGLYFGERSAVGRSAPLPENSLIISGGRQYDTGSNAWTTPDAFKGEIDDPASMERYMWNGNNAVRYRDPSGFQEDDAYERDAFEAENAPFPEPGTPEYDQMLRDPVTRFNSDYRNLDSNSAFNLFKAFEPSAYDKYGNQNLPNPVSYCQAFAMGRSFVGEGGRILYDKEARPVGLRSEDGLRQFRFPSVKGGRKAGQVEANFEILARPNDASKATTLNAHVLVIS